MIERPLWMRLWYDFAATSTRFAARLFLGLRYTGLENVPREGAVIVAANHQSTLDPPLIGGCSPRRMNFLARATLYRFKPFGEMIRALNAIPLDQEGSPLTGMREAMRRLKEGEPLLIFPEGARSWTGEIEPFQSGFTVLARRSRAAIVPAAIEGAFDAWPRWQKYPRIAPVHLHYGPAMSPDEVQRLKGDDLVHEVERRVRAIHAELCRREVFLRRTRRPKRPSE
jgi:1-acyl-sn-glycerol-3-phosphate acyltransferase